MQEFRIEERHPRIWHGVDFSDDLGATWRRAQAETEAQDRARLWRGAAWALLFSSVFWGALALAWAVCR